MSLQDVGAGAGSRATYLCAGGSARAEGNARGAVPGGTVPGGAMFPAGVARRALRPAPGEGQLDDLNMQAWLDGVVTSYWPQVRDLGIAYALAFVIGWNREREAHSAGLRTFPLVAVASCGFVQMAETLTIDDANATARLLVGVMTGIGFLGGGAILKGGGEVHGTATAASIWATGAIGAAVALGSYHVAVTVCLFTGVTLYLMTPLKKEHASGDIERGEAASPKQP